MNIKYQAYKRIPTGYGLYTYVKQGRAIKSIKNLQGVMSYWPYGGYIAKQYTNNIVWSIN